MPVQAIFPGVYVLALGTVNVFFIEDGDRLALVDTGYAGSEETILAAARELGRQPHDITHIILTHCHPDHAGSLAALKQQTGAQAWIHPVEANVVRGRTPIPGYTVSPGLLNQILYFVFIRGVLPHVPAAEIEHTIGDGDVLPIGGGLQAIYTPGHSAGHTAFLLRRDGGLLFAADACSNIMRLSYSIVYADFEMGKRSLAKLAAYDVAAICFGHGGALTGDGVKKFRRKWSV
jgi:glyoxylase-like metal-dependent hydrolase (beta-lactamase superfamily II)